MDEYFKFRNFELVTRSELLLANNYICAQLNGNGPNYKYYYDMYSYATKCFTVLEWKDKNGYNQITRFGEALCNNEIVNFLKDDEHKKCDCGSVYYNAVFNFCNFFQYKND